MFGGLTKLFKGDPAKKTQERLQPIVDEVNALESSMAEKSDDELRAVTQELKRRAASGTALDDLLPEAFAVRCPAMPLT
jgi:preprotein translocase subunit SecA